VLHDYPGELSWVPPLLIAACVLAALVLVLARSKRARLVAAGVGVGALLLAPSVWAIDTLGHATNGTFPEGGPANVQRSGGGRFGGPGGFGGPGTRGTAGGRGSFAPGASGGQALFGSGTGEGAGASASRGTGEGSATGAPSGAGTTAGGPPEGVGSAAGPGAGAGIAPGGAGAGARAGGSSRAGGFNGGGFGGGAPGSPMSNNSSIEQALSYVKSHGGGTIAVSSQSSAAQSIIASGAKVAGIGGFSGRESDVSASWLAQRVQSGAIRWVLVEQSGFGGASFGGRGLPGDTRQGSKAAMTAVAKACTRVTLADESSTSEGASGSESLGGETAGGSGLYDCRGDAAALARA
jgi:hypothetical protein